MDTGWPSHYIHAVSDFIQISQGLEEIADADFSVAQSGKAAADLFSLYLNCCPESMGVKGVRREDEVLLSLGYLHPALAKYGDA